VRPDGRPHVTPLIGVWVDGALVFRVAPVTAFGFAKSPYGQTRWRFA